MTDREKVIHALDCCLDIIRSGRWSSGCISCPYAEMNNCREQMIIDALELLKEQGNLIDELLELGYPHNFQHEAPWVVDYLYSLTEIIKKAFKAKEGR